MGYQMSRTRAVTAMATIRWATSTDTAAQSTFDRYRLVRRASTLIRCPDEHYQAATPHIRLGFAVRTVNQPGLAGGASPHLSKLLVQAMAQVIADIGLTEDDTIVLRSVATRIAELEGDSVRNRARR